MLGRMPVSQRLLLVPPGLSRALAARVSFGRLEPRGVLTAGRQDRISDLAIRRRAGRRMQNH